MPQLRIACDANVPLAHEAFGRYGPVRLLPGHTIARADLADADVLVVRSVTHVDADLLAGTPVRFVGTATAGTDHVRRDDLVRLGVAFASAPGSNAMSVVEYVLAALLELAGDEELSGKVLGVVGAGAVGGRLVPRARALGMSVLVCDPPRAATGHTDHDYRPLAEVLAASDIVTLHVPLTDAGPWPTRGMIGAEALAALRPGAWLVNAARGGVVDGPSLLAARPRPASGTTHLGALVLDCWPGEPVPDPALVAAADIATPHVAGYSAEGKLDGTVQLDAALRAWTVSMGLEAPSPWSAPPPPARFVNAPRRAPGETQASWLARLQRAAYDIRRDDACFRTAMSAAGPDPAARAAAFAELRRTYPARHENASVAVRGPVPEALRRAVADGLGMQGAGT